MYINEVIRMVNNYLPSEYSTNEMYIWCNELSAMLAVTDRCTYKEKMLPIAEDGTVLLPDGVSFLFRRSVLYVITMQAARIARLRCRLTVGHCGNDLKN